ncbi:aminotransferase class I/II-fold pyridoxal phosphate-dependent enzyme [Oceanobacillus salinisoli]|uniref:aminotransferase class I/II-fold pyridoxal phosphate-dependent enzyme n=1 Tax=Oceanobacillus salinisoli TaxID=2678611 RepID=UPI0012E124B9|nr:aminotransferase class I/II-fold pyridoxal phosphate-dependent enzyme [Oceanobacillus salinisoli]
MNQNKLPLYSTVHQFASNDPVSFHVPGHKNGRIFPEHVQEDFRQILRLDVTELSGLDDLHAPAGAIKEAQQLAADFFQADDTFFLVGGSTAGNLAMILACCHPGDKVIVQRNSHKSIFHALELSGAKPVFLAPEYDKQVGRFTSPSLETVKASLKQHRDAKAVVLTYPDYFGKTYQIKRMIDWIHTYHIPVLVDEAHGVHFSLGEPFPPSALHLGADVVVQSAHKTAPAMTQSSYLHIKSSSALRDKIAYYLQMLQSSSPSYPLMASLDIARYFLATRTKENLRRIECSIRNVRALLEKCICWDVLPHTDENDLLKITLHVKPGFSIQEVVASLEESSIFPELTTDNQILLVHGLASYENVNRLKKAIKRINERLKKGEIRATIDISELFPKSIKELALSYQEMNQLTYTDVPLEKGIGKIAAESIIPYPPGIPLVLKGEEITETHLFTINYLLQQGVKLQQRTQGIRIYSDS